jgi:hypothetical protein
VLLRRCRQPRGRIVAVALGARRGGAARLEREARRLAPRLEILDFLVDVGGASRQTRGLLLAELLLVLARGEVQLAGVRVLAQRRGALIGLGQLDPQPGEIRFELGEPRRGRRLPLARLREPRAGRLRWPRPARGSGARRAPSPTAAARPASACSGVPWQPAASRCRAASRPRRRCRRCG